MDLKEFTKQTLIQIVEGAASVNDELAVRGAYIPYSNLRDSNMASSVDEERISRVVINVNFDVAITTTDTEGSNGGGGLKVAGFFRVEGNAENKVENQTISRIKYTLPLVLAKKEQ